MLGGWTYIMTNKPHGVLYIGVTAHLLARVDQHRQDRGSSFCRRYGLKRLVWPKRMTTSLAIIREKQLKAWQRAWKIKLIEQANPEWLDLFDRIA